MLPRARLSDPFTTDLAGPALADVPLKRADSEAKSHTVYGNSRQLMPQISLPIPSNEDVMRGASWRNSIFSNFQAEEFDRTDMDTD